MNDEKPSVWNILGNVWWGLGIATQSILIAVFLFMIIALIKMGIQAL